MRWRGAQLGQEEGVDDPIDIRDDKDDEDARIDIRAQPPRKRRRGKKCAPHKDPDKDDQDAGMNACDEPPSKRPRTKKGDPDHHWLCKGFTVLHKCDDEGTIQTTRASCILCSRRAKLQKPYQVFKRGSQSASWSGPKGHLSKKHNVHNLAELEDELARPWSSGQMVLGTGLTPVVDAWSPQSQEWKKACSGLGQLVSALNLPYQLGQRTGFTRFMRKYVPRWPRISRQSLTRSIEHQSDAIQLSIKQEMQEVTRHTGVAMTCDVWTSRANQAYLTGTFHWLDDAWTLKRHILGVDLCFVTSFVFWHMFCRVQCTGVPAVAAAGKGPPALHCLAVVTKQ